MIVGIDNITPGTSTSSSLTLGSMRPYMQDLLSGLPAALPDCQFKFFTPAWNEPFEITHPNIEAVVCPGASRFRPRRVWFEQMTLPGIIADRRVDIWLGTCNYLPLRTKAKTFLIVQSHQFFTNPDCYKFVRRAFLQWIVTRSVKNADKVGVQSKDAKATLLKYIDVPAESISVVYNRLVNLGEPDPAAAAALLTRIMGSIRPYILYVSGLYPFKNHPRLIEAFSRIQKDFPDLALLLAGGNGEGRTASELRAIAVKNGVGDRVFVPGRVSQAETALLYRNARASAFPSLEETFGLPILESMSLDCPVLTSNTSSMAEIAGDAAILVNPLDIDAIAHGLRTILSDEDLRRDLIGKGRARCAFFTKERTIRSIAAGLEELAMTSGNRIFTPVGLQ
jgi:glycosyltransferase involved in cell wall biosynthesis